MADSLQLFWMLVVCLATLPPVYVTAGSTCTKAWVEYLGMTRQETGSLQIGYTTEADCRARCEALTTCVSYDFDPPAIFGCSVYEDNLVDRLDDHPTINHYQLEVTCVLQDAEQTTCTYKYVGEYTFVDASIAVPAETVDEDTCLRACTQNANCLSAAVLAGDVMPCTLSGDPLVYDNSRTTDPGRKQYEQIQCTRQDTTTAAPTTAAPTTASTTAQKLFPLCYADPLWPKIDRSNDTAKGGGGFDHTTAWTRCRDHCRDTAGTVYFGVRRDSSQDGIPYSGVTCYCGDDLTSQPVVPASQCSLTCEGDFPCGGPGDILREMSAYSVCSAGKYGPSCSLDCRRDCDGGECFPDSGHCCPAGRYGTDCLQNCANDNCQDGPCDWESGVCDGCMDYKWYGDQCRDRCPNVCTDRNCNQQGTCNRCNEGLYGTQCTLNCPPNCAGPCRRYSGICERGCYGTFKGPYCNSTCPVNCKNEVCSEDRVCFDGCLANFQGHRCTECPDSCAACDGTVDTVCDGCSGAWYGESCHLTCSHCSLCNQDDGICTECASGYRLVGDICEKEQDIVPIVVPVIVVVLVVVLAISLAVYCVRRRKSDMEQNTTAASQMSDPTYVNQPATQDTDQYV